jgi:hypothetical protein
MLYHAVRRRPHGAASRSAIESDRAAVEEAQAAIDRGDPQTADQVGALRAAVQRIMCLAASSYPEYLCAIL